MPTATSSSTPGPSNINGSASVANKKRPSDSDAINARDVKKVKKNQEDAGSEGQEKSKKKRSKGSKRRRKVSLVQDIERPSTSKGRSADGTSSASVGTSLAVPVDGGPVQNGKIASTSHQPRKETSAEDISMADHKLEPNSATTTNGSSGPSSHPTAGPPADLEKDRKILELKKQIHDKTKLAEKHENAFSQIQQNITCQICLDYMYKPFALAPCGHLACYSCLVQWFSAPPPNTNGLPTPPAMYRQKSCPHCRAVIRERPTEVWDVKNIVVTLTKSGLLPNATLPAETPTVRPPVDPWANIFRPANQAGLGLENFHPLLQHVFHDPDPEERPNPDGGPTVGWQDNEDGGIYRCFDCMHEIWGGHCSSCGRVYPDHPEYDEDADEDYDDEDGIDIHIIDSGEEDEDGHWRNPIFDPLMRGFINDGDDDDDDDDEEDDDEDDDEGSDHEEPGVWRPNQGDRGRPRRDQTVINLADVSSDDEHDDFFHPRPYLPNNGAHVEDVYDDRAHIFELTDEEDAPPPVGEYGALGRSYRGGVIHVDSDGEVGGPGREPVRGPRGAARVHRIVTSDEEDEDEDDNDNGSVDYRTTGGARRNIVVSDDEEEEDDGSIPGPASRLRHLFTGNPHLGYDGGQSYSDSEDNEEGEMYGWAHEQGHSSNSEEDYY